MLQMKYSVSRYDRLPQNDDSPKKISYYYLHTFIASRIQRRVFLILRYLRKKSEV